MKAEMRPQAGNNWETLSREAEFTLIINCCDEFDLQPREQARVSNKSNSLTS